MSLRLTQGFQNRVESSGFPTKTSVAVDEESVSWPCRITWFSYIAAGAAEQVRAFHSRTEPSGLFTGRFPAEALTALLRRTAIGLLVPSLDRGTRYLFRRRAESPGF